MAKKKVAKKKVTKKPAHPKFKFVGNGENDPFFTGYRGYTFKLNGPAVAIKEPDIAAKLKNNTHFKEV